MTGYYSGTNRGWDRLDDVHRDFSPNAAVAFLEGSSNGLAVSEIYSLVKPKAWRASHFRRRLFLFPGVYHVPKGERAFKTRLYAD